MIIPVQLAEDSGRKLKTFSYLFDLPDYSKKLNYVPPPKVKQNSKVTQGNQIRLGRTGTITNVS